MSASAQNESRKRKTKQVVTVVPLHCVTYVLPSGSYTTSVSANKSTDNVKKVVLQPAELRQDQFNDFVAETQTRVTLTGSAALGQNGPTIGMVDIAESDHSYFFRVLLPGVSRDEMEFACKIDADGTVVIEGETTTGEKTVSVCMYSQVFKMQTQNLCPPGYFTIEFQLPGPVKNEDFIGTLEFGLLKGVVKKLKENSVSELFKKRKRKP